MIDWKANADYLLEEFNLCIAAKPRHNVVDIQIEKDAVAKFAYQLNNIKAWGTDEEIAAACLLFTPKLDDLKTKLILDILRNG